MRITVCVQRSDALGTIRDHIIDATGNDMAGLLATAHAGARVTYKGNMPVVNSQPLSKFDRLVIYGVFTLLSKAGIIVVKEEEKFGVKK